MEYKETKRKFALWIKDSTMDMVRMWYQKDNCRSLSEYIEKAVLFYNGYLAANKSMDFLPVIITSPLKSIVAESDNKRDRMLFKLAVEMAVMMNVVAATNEIDPLTLERLRGECVKEVKRTNGTFSFKDAVDWQR